jgi:hypothetical protein
MSEQPPKKPGRRARKTPHHLTTIRLPEPWYEALRDQAHDERRAMADLIKEALMDKYGFPPVESRATA